MAAFYTFLWLLERMKVEFHKFLPLVKTRVFKQRTIFVLKIFF